jgi:DNA polymerase-1
MLTIDFETEAIVGNPIFNPPKPVGVSIKFGADTSRYLAWGHPTGNNCTHGEAYHALKTALGSSHRAGGWLAHNAPFECAVLRKWFDYTAPDPLLVHDTQFELFLTDPYAFSLALKPSAERVLGIAPEEQETLMRWILANVPQATKKDWGAYISCAPGDMVAPYACGDTDRTYALHAHLMPQIVDSGMLGACQREQLLAPILARSTVHGVRVDMEKLESDILVYTEAQARAEEYIHDKLGQFNIDSDAELADALDRTGMVQSWVLTPTGKRSTARKNLVGNVGDPDLLHYLSYRGVLATCLGTFAVPWLQQARQEGGRLHPQWNQVRGEKGEGGDMSGTRTGRMSCKNPNLQNPPNNFDGLVIPPGLPDVMHMRKYLLPDEGTTWLKRDFSAQEMRIMAHFAEGSLFEAFKRDPTTDPHVMVKGLIDQRTGGDMPRKYVKITGFGIMYGRGVPNLSSALDLPVEEGRKVQDAYFAALPEVRELSYETRARGKRNLPIKTWGGRLYYREPHPERDLSYKLLNYLIQGSAADQTKQSMIDWDAARSPNDVLLAAVHDEINICVPSDPDSVKLGMCILREQMNAPRFDVPFMSEGYIGDSWDNIRKYDDAA